MATPILGLKRFFLVDTNDSLIPANENWVRINRQSGGTMDRAANKVDTTSKDDAGFTSELVTTKTWTMTAEGQEVPHNLALRTLARKFQSITEIDMVVHLKLFTETGEEFVGFASLDSYNQSFGTNEPVTYSVSFTGRGPLTTR